MKKVFYVETTTDGRTLLYCHSNSDRTDDVEVIEIPSVIKEKGCDCEYELVMSDKGHCKKCGDKLYNFLTNKQ